ncbi:MAG: hypothetical protein LBH72_02230, partial [Proteiniphilum sp.]|nr:hypothetical protein [Proteiniphilum sp.]
MNVESEEVKAPGIARDKKNMRIFKINTREDFFSSHEDNPSSREDFFSSHEDVPSSREDFFSSHENFSSSIEDFFSSCEEKK